MRLIDADKIDSYSELEYESKNVVLEEIPTVEAIPKDIYETRLKADMVAMLSEIQLEIDENIIVGYDIDYRNGFNHKKLNDLGFIQEKINALKENEDGNEK